MQMRVEIEYQSLIQKSSSITVTNVNFNIINRPDDFSNKKLEHFATDYANYVSACFSIRSHIFPGFLSFLQKTIK